MKAVSSVQVCVSGPVAWVRVAGRGTFQNSTGLKEFAAEMMRRGHKNFVVDLSACELMDSTFMGTLAGIALKLGNEGGLKVVYANPRNRQVMLNLGLDRVLALEDQAPPAPEPALQDAETNPPRTAERSTIIEAHESLVAANPQNAERFKDVLEFLKQKEPPEDPRP